MSKELKSLTPEELLALAQEQAATIESQAKEIASLGAAVAALNEQLSEKEEMITAGKVTCTVGKKKYEIVSKRVRVTAHVGDKETIDWPLKLGKTLLTAVELTKEKAYLEFLVSQGSGILREVEIKEK